MQSLDCLDSALSFVNVTFGTTVPVRFSDGQHGHNAWQNTGQRVHGNV
jgi:hypothetical protein